MNMTGPFYLRRLAHKYVCKAYVMKDPSTVKCNDLYEMQSLHDIMKNEVIGQGTVVRWEGADSDGNKVRIGPYVIWIEMTHPNGKVKQYKEICIVAERL